METPTVVTFVTIYVDPMRLAPLLLLTMVILLSCQRPQLKPEPAQYSVPVEIEPYVQHFRDEFKKRGQTPTTNNLIITFGATQGSDVCGQCLLESGKTPRIIINTNGVCWRDANGYERECLVFHELGHCLLNRGHRNSRFPNNAYVSLMNTNDWDIFGPCTYPVGNDECDKRPRRDYYLDELADSTTSAPIWAK
ncbi:MAG: hypothetical protein JWP57_2741 [Spirosoma sp.]|nr:hypothetical protein [Spirosoma sp.]